MIIEAAQQFTLEFPGSPEDALAFVRDPARSLAQVRFLRGLSAGPDGVRGDLIVQLPVLGEADLPFFSVLELSSGGAVLVAQLLENERAWVEVAGTAQVQSPETAGHTPVQFDFQFRAHLTTPDTGSGAAPGWGGAAFGKMVRAAATRTLERVAQELPGGIRTAMQAEPPAGS